jgi:hypothetical protein
LLGKEDAIDMMLERRSQMEFNSEFDSNISVNLYDEVNINVEDLDTEFIILPSQIAYWTVVTARFEQVVLAMERDYELWYAGVYNQAFDKLEQLSGRKPNMSSVDYYVKMYHKDLWLEKTTALEKAKSDLTVIRGLLTALNTKLQCLMQLSKRRLGEVNALEPIIRMPEELPKGTSVQAAKELFKQMKGRTT